MENKVEICGGKWREMLSEQVNDDVYGGIFTYY
jgi:hypothetical protein